MDYQSDHIPSRPGYALFPMLRKTMLLGKPLLYCLIHVLRHLSFNPTFGNLRLITEVDFLRNFTSQEAYIYIYF
jgi:hypothetical protein